MSGHLSTGPLEEAMQQHRTVLNADGVRQLLGHFPLMALLVNAMRQIVYANPASEALLSAGVADALIGLRPGEAMHCRHSDETQGGCGTTEFCTLCGADKALRAAQRGEQASEDCRIVSKTLGDDLDLRVWAAPFAIQDETFTLVTLLDIRNQKRREALEQVFFHDVLNTAGGIYGVATLYEDASSEERDELAPVVGRLAAQLIDELEAQQSLTAMESGELPVQQESLSSAALLNAVAEAYRVHRVAAGRSIRIDPALQDVAFTSDGRLLRRVLGNLVKNALEACPAGGVVTLSAGSDHEHVCFRVHNPSAMPRDVQLQIFQRSFSTKGPGRGLGTYSVKLLSERYLKGAVSFTSSDASGTTFTATYPRRT